MPREVDYETAQRMVMLFNERFTVGQLFALGRWRWLIARGHIRAGKYEDTSYSHARLLAGTLPGGRWDGR